jgi:hypothetical protein
VWSTGLWPSLWMKFESFDFLFKTNITHHRPAMTLNDPFDDCHTRRLVIPLGDRSESWAVLSQPLWPSRGSWYSFFFFLFSAMSSWLSVQQKKWAQSMVWPFKIVNTSVSHSISKKWDNPRVKRFLAPFPLVFLPELIQVLKRNNKNQMKIVCFFSLKDALKEIVSESCKYVHHSLTTPRWNNFHQTDCGHLALYLCDIRELHNMREQRNRKSFSLNIPPSYMEHKWGQDVSRLYSCRVEKLETTGKDDQEGHRKE